MEDSPYAANGAIYVERAFAHFRLTPNGRLSRDRCELAEPRFLGALEHVQVSQVSQRPLVGLRRRLARNFRKNRYKRGFWQSRLIG